MNISKSLPNSTFVSVVLIVISPFNVVEVLDVEPKLIKFLVLKLLSTSNIISEILPVWSSDNK